MRGGLIGLSLIVLLLPTVLAQNLDTRIYTDKDGTGKDFGDISAVPGEFIEAFIQIENEYQDDDNDTYEIENIEVTLTIIDLDDGEDIEEDFEDFDLKADKKEKIPFSFQVPFEVEDKSYTISLDIDGVELDEEFSYTEEFAVNVNKRSHELFFETISFDPGVIGCNDVSYLNIIVYNIGKEDEEDIILSVKNQELDFSLSRQFNLDAYPEEIKYKNSVPIKIQSPASKTYEFEVSLEYSGLVTAKMVPLQLNCNGLQDTTQKPKTDQPVKETLNEKTPNPAIIAPPTVNNQDISPISQEFSKTVVVEDKSPNILPLAGIAILLLLIILIILLRKR